MPWTPTSLLAMKLERLDHAAAGLLGGIEEGDGGLIGRRFLVLAVGEQGAHRGIGPAEGRSHAGLTNPGAPANAPPTMAATPSSCNMSAADFALDICVRSRARWPPVI